MTQFNLKLVKACSVIGINCSELKKHFHSGDKTSLHILWKVHGASWAFAKPLNFCSSHQHTSVDSLKLTHNLTLSREYACCKMFVSGLLSFLQWLCVPFILMSPHSADITKTAFNFTYQPPWIGSVDEDKAWRWIDNFLLLVRTIFSNSILLLSFSAHAVVNDYWRNRQLPCK